MSMSCFTILCTYYSINGTLDFLFSHMIYISHINLTENYFNSIGFWVMLGQRTKSCHYRFRQLTFLDARRRGKRRKFHKISFFIAFTNVNFKLTAVNYALDDSSNEQPRNQ